MPSYVPIPAPTVKQRARESIEHLIHEREKLWGPYCESRVKWNRFMRWFFPWVKERDAAYYRSQEYFDTLDICGILELPSEQWGVQEMICKRLIDAANAGDEVYVSTDDLRYL